jgi:hypothetical protein
MHPKTAGWRIQCAALDSTHQNLLRPLAANVVLCQGTTPLIQVMPQGTPDNFPIIFFDLPGITYTSLVHIHFEDLNQVADFTGFAETQGAAWLTAGKTSISSATGSDTLDGKPALVTAQAELTAAPSLPWYGLQN